MNVKTIIFPLLLSTGLIALSGCSVINPQTTPESVQTQNSDVEPMQPPTQETTTPHLEPDGNETQHPASVNEPPRQEILVNERFPLGESITDEERGRIAHLQRL